jgi:hypothetical protein
MTSALESSLVKCSKCQTLLSPELFNLNQLNPCPSCHTDLDVEVFPAILNAPVAGPAPETLLVEGESSCFYHPGKKAAIVCQGCGRFLCSLCDLELNGRHVCPVCLEAGQKKAKFKDLENSRVLWDRLCLQLALLPIIFWPATIISGPVTLFLIFKHRKDPCSITGKSNLDFIVAGIFAALLTVGWVILVLFLINHKHR